MERFKLNNEDSISGVVVNNTHIRYIRKQPMELINEYTGLMQCKVCGQQHLADMKPNSNGRFYRGAWQCPNGCKI
jgi:hypothetical protein